MEFIQNTRKGSQLDTLNATAVPQCKSVLAAVAYVTDSRSLIDACGRHNKPLKLYARYDYSGPVSDQVLQWFLSRDPASYEMRLVADIFHPKVIWWEGVGVYIGSANLSKSAWTGNIEAGVFITEPEIDDNELRSDIEDFFDLTGSLSHRLTKEIAAEMVKAGTGPAITAQTRAEREFNQSGRLIPLQPSLISITRRPANEKKRTGFLQEWNETLELLRTISRRVWQPENRPVWLPNNVPPGVLLDQFLHAYYYTQVVDGRAHPFEEFHERHKADPKAALKGAIAWWQALTAAPNEEDIYMTTWAPRLAALLSHDSLLNLTQEQFRELCLHVHAVREHARQVESTTLGLQQGLSRMPKEQRVGVFANYLFTQRSQDRSSPPQVIDFVIHGGPSAETPTRLFAASHAGPQKILHLGLSALGEMVVWAMPNDFPPRNGRTSKALKALGFNVRIYGE
jgi:hypothetical protein